MVSDLSAASYAATGPGIVSPSRLVPRGEGIALDIVYFLFVYLYFQMVGIKTDLTGSLKRFGRPNSSGAI